MEAPVVGRKRLSRHTDSLDESNHLGCFRFDGRREAIREERTEVLVDADWPTNKVDRGEKTQRGGPRI